MLEGGCSACDRDMKVNDFKAICDANEVEVTFMFGGHGLYAADNIRLTG